MKTTRKRYSADLKAKVALEAIRGEVMLVELAANQTWTTHDDRAREAAGHRPEGRDVLPVSGGNHGLGNPQGACWRLLNTIDAGLCAAALEEALALRQA